jgi:hypothetical protein
MAYFLEVGKKIHPDANFVNLWPKSVTFGKSKTTFNFRDKEDYLFQQKNSALLRESIQLQGIDY